MAFALKSSSLPANSILFPVVAGNNDESTTAEGTSSQAMPEDGETKAEMRAQAKILERPEKRRLHWSGLTCTSFLPALEPHTDIGCQISRH